MVNAIFWLQIRKVWPPFTEAIASIATSPVAWFVVAMFILAVIAFHPRPSRHPTTAAPSGRKPKTEALADRIVVDVTPQYLIDFYTDRTSVQADALATMYIGKWLTVTGKVANIFKVFDESYRVALSCEPTNKLVTLNFGKNSQVIHIPLGTTITARGKIEQIGRLGVDLTECEMA